MTFEEFRENILNVSDTREHKVTGSLGVYDAYKWIRKNHWLDIGKPVSEKDFYLIIRTINNILADRLSQGKDVKLPEGMGSLELRKYKSYVDIKGNKIVTNLPIDWDATLRLWYEDSEAYKKQQLVRVELKELFKIVFNKTKAKFNNQIFYEFQVNRNIKKAVGSNFKQGLIDAFIIKV